MGKKIFFITVVLLFISKSITNIFSAEKVFLIYKNIEYYLTPASQKEINVENFNPLKEIDEEQKHRIILSANEKAKLTNLLYAGDKYSYNNIEVSLIFKDIYQIKNLANDITLKFKIGSNNEILTATALNFKITGASLDYKPIKLDKKIIIGSASFDTIDKLASTVYIKELLKQLNGTPSSIEKPVVIKEADKTIISNEYEKFVENLSTMEKNEIFKSLNRFIELNIRFTGKRKISEEWIHPANIYFYKECDYKSAAFFYYYTLKKIDEINIKKNKPPYTLFNPRSYFVINLEKKPQSEIAKIFNAFSNKYKTTGDLEKIQELELQYKYVDIDPELKYNPERPSYSKAITIYYYKAPELYSSVYLVTVNIDGKWIYTTGEKWIDANVTQAERICSAYSTNGCYYTFVENDFMLLNNMPLRENDVSWKIIY